MTADRIRLKAVNLSHVSMGLLLLTLMSFAFSQSAYGVPAFPSAEGFGVDDNSGFRGGAVLVVDTLADHATNPPTGSLRWAVNQSGPRIIVFRVSGDIFLKKELNISNGNVYIAGQTSPSGIQLRTDSSNPQNIDDYGRVVLSNGPATS